MKKNRGLWFVAAAAATAWYMTRRRKHSRNAAQWDRSLKEGERPTALITGASSGIGKAFARALAARGWDLILTARREALLRLQAEDYRQRYGISAEVVPADLSTEAGIRQIENTILAKGNIDLLINNAGYDVFGLFVETPIEKTLELINCLEIAPVRLCRAVLPGMIDRKRGAIINVSSIGAFYPKLKDTTYDAAKAYLHLFSQSLSIEMQGLGVRIQSLCPGLTSSEFHDAPQYANYRIKERIPGWMWMTPEAVVQSSLTALARGQEVCIPGLINRFIVLGAQLGLNRLFTGVLRRILAKTG